jgi:alpha-galactosidase
MSGSAIDSVADDEKGNSRKPLGIYMQEFVKEPILIIKTAWGGKGLCVDFRPPSARPYEAGKTRERQGKDGDRRSKDVERIVSQRREASGRYYRLMMQHVKKVLADIKRVYPGYSPETGYEVAGFVWFQGCNDFGDITTYPNAGKRGGHDEYSRLFACLIRDVRKDLDAPEMRAVIGVLGINGSLEGERVRQIDPKQIPWLHEFRRSMAAPTSLPQFKGTVAAVLTEKFWDPRLEELQSRWGRIKAKSGELKKERSLSRAQRDAEMEKFRATVYSPEEWRVMETGVSNAAYHYLGSAKIIARIGKGLAEAMIEMQKQ